MKLTRLLAATTAAAALFAASGAHALEITSDETTTPQALADTLFLDVAGSISNISVTSSGAPAQFGTFTNDSGTYGLPAEGIVLSTGNVADYGDGPNTESGRSTDFESLATLEQENLLDPITGGGFVPIDDPIVIDDEVIFEGGEGGVGFAHFDVAQLTITFDAGEDVTGVTFFGTFGSEEFPEFVGDSFIDGFGLFVNGENVAFANGEPINVNHPDFLGAFVEGEEFEGGGEFELAVNNDDFVEVNLPGEGGGVAASTSLEPGDPRLAFVTGTELDGVIAPDGNPVLRFDVPVNAGESNTFDIIIADTSDGILDSTIFLSSFQPQELDLNDGGTEFTPLLPGDRDPNNGAFIFDLTGIENLEEIFFIDPPVSVGYIYTVQDAEFAMIQAPSLATINDPDGFIISIAGQADVILSAGQILDVSALGISEFTLSGIDPSLMLDPANPLAFPLGVSLQNLTPGVGPTISQQALTVDVDAAVPLPAGLPLYLSALGAFLVFRRLRSA